MRKLIAICSFGLILWLAAAQNAWALANYDNLDTDSTNKIHKTKQWSGMMNQMEKQDKNENKKMKRWSWVMGQTWWMWGEGRFGSGEMFSWRHLGSWEVNFPRMWSGAWLSGEREWWPMIGSWKKIEWTGDNMNKVGKKIYRNEFNDDLNKVLKFLNPGLTKDQKKEVGTIIAEKRTSLKTIYNKVRSDYQSWITIDLSWYINTLTNEFNDLSARLSSYVDASKTTQFQTFISNKINLIARNLQAKINKK